VLEDVIGYLACRSCGQGLHREGGTLRCPAGHSYDIARQGYVSMLPAGAKAGAGDTGAMTAARADFLGAGHFGSLATELAAAAQEILAPQSRPGQGAGGEPDGEPGAEAEPGGLPGCVIDVGAGTGYYLASVLEAAPGRAGLALDISKFALRRAARAHPRIGAVGCDVWQHLPVADGAAQVVLSVFAPRHGAELRRILRPGGSLLVLTPAPDHLGELVAALGLLTVDPRKPERLAGKLGPYLRLAGRQELRVTMSLGHEAIGQLVAMGPSAWHLNADTATAGIGRLPDPMPVTLAVSLSRYQRADGELRQPGSLRLSLSRST
jgi:23S rRNA (guanine745-N1)-methyltransferase